MLKEKISFLNKIENEIKIEPRDEMPEEYVVHLQRQISQHAHSEIIGMQPEGNWVLRAPSLQAKLILIAKIQDEAGHGLYLYSAAETLGKSREEFIEDLQSGKAKYSSIFNYPALTWSDIGTIGWLVDGAAIINQVSLQGTSYGPYSRAMKRICMEESFHQRQGYEIVAKMANGSARQKEEVQDALNRFWWPSLMMFGPHDSDSPRTANASKWKIKRETNDELRQKFIDKTVQQAEILGLKIPDANLKFNEQTQHYEHSDINWDEFWSVVNGNGPCNEDRMIHYKKAHNKGTWVREASIEFANKKLEHLLL